MARWLKTCTEFAKVRVSIESENLSEIIKGLIEICDKYAKENWDFADDYARLSEELSETIDDEKDYSDDEVDYWLSEFYDLCDNARVWLEV